jgi:hypothetical protein
LSTISKVEKFVPFVKSTQRASKARKVREVSPALAQDLKKLAYSPNAISQRNRSELMMYDNEDAYTK